MLTTETREKEDRTGALIMLAGVALGAIGIAGYVVWALSGNFVRDGNWIGVDFHVYYQAALVLRRGQDIYTAGISPPYVYPPLLATLVTPLSALSVTTATILWKLSQHVFLLIAGALLASMTPAKVRPLAAGILLLGLLAVPVRDEIQVGESNSLVLALVVGTIWLIDKLENAGLDQPSGERQIWWLAGTAGGLLALAASIKVLPVLLIAYLWWRGPRRVAAIATGLFAGLQLLLLALTPSTADYWLVQFPGLFGQAFPYLDNQSFNAFIARATVTSGDPGMPTMQLFDGESVRPALTWLANLLALAGAAWILARARRGAWRESRAGTSRLLLEFSLVLMTIHLVSGSTWLHHLVDLSVPVSAFLGFSAIATTVRGKGTRSIYSGWVLLVATFAVLLPHPADWVVWADAILPGVPVIAWLAGSLPMLAVIGWWAWVARLLTQSHGSNVDPLPATGPA